MLKSILTIIANLIKYFTSKGYRVKRKAQKQQKRSQERQEAIEKGDTDKVNKDIKRILKIVVIGVFLVGCTSTEIVYVDEEVKARPLPYEELHKTINNENYMNEDIKKILEMGVDGWFVPNSRMKQLLDKADKAE